MPLKLIRNSLLIVLSLFTLLAACKAVTHSDEQKIDSPWIPLDARVKVWDAVVAEQLAKNLPFSTTRPYSISKNNLEATFEKDGATWTIIGANSPTVNPTLHPKEWPVKGNNFEIAVIREPITNHKILPFSEKIENAVSSETISIVAAPDSYEPVSFVIRSGDETLKDVMVEISDLKSEGSGLTEKNASVISKDNIDIRVVKCWYQAGIEIDDTKHKVLTPELLLHDDDLVRVDYINQLNMVRNLTSVEDAKTLKRFGIARHQNKQIWITVHVTNNHKAGKYTGDILVTSGDKSKMLKLLLTVLPLSLPEPMLEYGLYYEGKLSGSHEPIVEAGLKTERQMKYELEDMRAHGLTNATVWHQVNDDPAKWEDDWQRLLTTLKIRDSIGWEGRPLLYLDWKTKFREQSERYAKKISTIVKHARDKNIQQVYIYGVDEQKDKALLELNNSTYILVHNSGAKNFVAGYIQSLVTNGSNIDLMVINGKHNDSRKMLSEKIPVLKQSGKSVYLYNFPQAGMEEPETYRNNYGIGLLKFNVDGALNYAYQTGPCWNDFLSPKFRTHTMSYPTIGKPVPTIQWEGWRKGIDDVRYLTLLKQKQILNESWLQEYCDTPKNCRNSAIKMLTR